MKILQTTIHNLNDKEFNQLSDKIIDKLYSFSYDIKELYDIHINYIDDSWRIDFIPIMKQLPVIKVDTEVKQYQNGKEILKITPVGLSEFPGRIRFQGQYADIEDLCTAYSTIFDYVLDLHRFEFVLT